MALCLTLLLRTYCWWWIRPLLWHARFQDRFDGLLIINFAARFILALLTSRNCDTLEFAAILIYLLRVLVMCKFCSQTCDHIVKVVFRGLVDEHLLYDVHFFFLPLFLWLLLLTSSQQRLTRLAHFVQQLLRTFRGELAHELLVALHRDKVFVLLLVKQYVRFVFSKVLLAWTTILRQ